MTEKALIDLSVSDCQSINPFGNYHLARKSFSVSVCLSNNVPIESLSPMLGHASVAVTLQAYPSITDEKISEDFKGLRKRLVNRNRSIKKKSRKQAGFDLHSNNWIPVSIKMTD